VTGQVLPMSSREKHSESRREMFVRRMAICLAAAFLLVMLEFYTIDAVRYPAPVLYVTSVPTRMYCYYLSVTETLPRDDMPILEAGRLARCFFVGLILNVPYFALLIFGGWWLVDKTRRLSFK
jgi:hypothetical protein